MQHDIDGASLGVWLHAALIDHGPLKRAPWELAGVHGRRLASTEVLDDGLVTAAE